MDRIYYLLVLLSVPGLGPYRIRKLVGHFGTPQKVLKSNMGNLCSVEGIDKKMAEQILSNRNSKFAERQLHLCKKYNVKVIDYWDELYPDLLKKIYDPPVLLFVRGILPWIPCIAVVGTRRPSQYGMWVGGRLGEDLVKRGAVVVSGMARGVDTHAHRGALKASGKTIAVLGSGVDVVYPPENGLIYKNIINSGAVISEFPMGTEPSGGHFPRRNRIISGLSLGTVVVEAGERSGALITAYMALEQGRDVFAVPGPIKGENSKGPHRLLKEGAKLVESVDDIVSEIRELQVQSPFKKETKQSVTDTFTQGEKRIWDVLSDDPLHIDQIATKLAVSTSEALATLLSLELKNCVKQLTGMRFIRQ